MRSICIALAIIFIIVSPAVSVQASGYHQEPDGNTIYLPIISYQLPQPTWIGPNGGRVVVMAINPIEPSIVYAGSWGAGVFKSENGGSSWKHASDGLGNGYINSIAIAPSDPDTLYAGTYTDGVYKTIDGGQSWFHANQGIQDLAIVYTIAIDPTDSNKVYAGTRSGSPMITDRPWHGAAYRSVNGGENWTLMGGTDSIGGAGVLDWFYSIAINPVEPNILLGAAHESGPYRSMDSGENWGPVKTGIVNCVTPPASGCHGRSIVYDPRPENVGTAYLGTWRGNGVYKTINNGSSWVQKKSGLLDTDIYHLAIDTLNPSKLYAATFGGTQIKSGVLKTTTSAESWFAAGLTNQYIYSVEVDPTNSNVVYAGTLGYGLSKSTNGGASWFSSQTGLINTGIASTIVTAGNSSILYTAMNDSGVARSLDGGQTWIDYSGGLGDRKIHAMASPGGSRSNILYALTDQSGVYTIDINKGVWLPTAWVVSASVSEDITFDRDHPFASREALLDEPEDLEDISIDSAIQASIPLLSLAIGPPPNKTYLMYVGTSGKGVYRTVDGGGRWEAAGLSGLSVWSLATDSINGYTVYAATNSTGVIKTSTNAGSSWTNTYLPNSGLTAYIVMFSKTNPEIVYAGTSSGLYRRVSIGPWNLVGLEGLSVTAIAENPYNAAVIYAGTTDGLRVSFDSGNSWEPGPSLLNGITVQTITVDPNYSNFVYVGTKTHGILRVYFR